MIKKYYQRKYAPRLKSFEGRPDCTPFLDVFFLLLIFMIMSLPFVQLSGIEVTLPQVESGRIRSGLERFIITITMSPDGNEQLYFNDKPLTQDQLAEELSQISTQSELKMIIVRADASAPHSTVTEVMAIAARFGLSTFLATSQPEKPQGNTPGTFVPSE